MKKKMLCLLAISLLLVLISCVGASAIQTSMGKIRVMDVRIPMPQGEELRVLIHKPDTATKDNPAPCVITSHGYHATLETQDITSIELARRGFVVFNMDTYSAGDSSGTVEAYGYNRTYYGLGMLQLVEYVYNNIDYIDRERIGITGHSTGGRNVSFTLDAYGRNEHDKVYSDQPADGGDYTTKVSSALILAFFPDRYLLSNLPSGVNVGINFARYDEGATVQVTKVDGYQWPDMTVSPEAKFFINQTEPGTFTMDTEITTDPDTGKDKVELSGYVNSEKVEIGKYYGNIGDGTMRVVYNPPTSHQWQFFSPMNATITNQFFMDTLGAPKPINAKNQVWLLKECFNAVGIVGFFMFLLPFAALLMRTPFFEGIRQEVPAPRPRPTDKLGKTVSIVSLILLAVIPGITVMPLFSKVAYGLIFSNGAVNNTTRFFPQPGPNAIIIWALFNGLVAIVIFALSYFIYGKKHGDSPTNWGIKTSWANIGKTALLAIIVASAAYGLVLLSDLFFTTDFRLWSFAIRAARGNILRLVPHYLPFMLVFWLATSFMVNANARTESKKEWHNTALCVVVNVFGLAAIVAIQFIVLFSTGLAMWYANRAWVNVCLIIPFIPMMAIGTVILRKAYKQTGTIYFGAFLMALVSTTIMVAGANTIMRIMP